MKRICIAISALFMGSMIYLLWRTDSLAMFTWFDCLGLGGTIAWLRIGLGPFSIYLPDWFIFSIPNALWFFSGLIVFNSIWGMKPSWDKRFWLSSFCVIALGSEVAQAFQLIPGTFDYQDLIFMIIAGIASAFCIPNHNHKIETKGGR